MEGPVGAQASAGTLLRNARQAQGLHIAALAASIKVAPRKLELLEAGRYDELPDATFTRALAQTMCRALKIDPVPVLALLPEASNSRLELVSEGLNAPFRDRPGRAVAEDWSAALRPAVWLPLIVVLAALALYFLPPGLLGSLPGAAAPASGAQPASAAAATGTVREVVSPMSIAPEAPAASASSAASAPAVVPAPVLAQTPPPASLLQVRASQSSWVEVLDATGQSLVSRTVQPGETVDLDGRLPLRLKIGNVAGTQLSFRGEPVSLAPYTRDNVARFELK
jgi:cytoskeleton protein RodZ